MSHTLPLCTTSLLLSSLSLGISLTPPCGGAVVLIVVSTIMLGPMEACNEDGHTPDVGEGVLPRRLVIITLICLVTLPRYLVSLSCLIFVLMSFLVVSCSACPSLCCLLLDPPKSAISCLSCLVALPYLASLSRSACLLDLHNVCLFDYRTPLMWLLCRCGWS